MKKNSFYISILLLSSLILTGCGKTGLLYANSEKAAGDSSFLPGAQWKDTDGNVIQAHGGQVQKMEVPDGNGGTTEKYIWIGENKLFGSKGDNVAVYSSDDLYSWKYEGDVLKSIASREEMDTDPYFVSLYQDYTSDQKDHVYSCINKSAVMERPKMLYNKKTNKYVIWFHNDTATEKNSRPYDAGMSGVAISDSPYGPFRYIDRYRLDHCPEGQIDVYPSSKGEARDLNLFQEEDGTAYVVYTSENNKSLYISKLNEEYTYLSKDPEEAVYKEDYIRIFPGAMREGPALTKASDGRYYLMSSSTTGWASNEARVYSADSIFGDWVYDGNPCQGKGASITFDTQSTCIFTAPNGQMIYYGDRWNTDDLADSRYIWLPVTLENKKLSITWEQEWSWEN